MKFIIFFILILNNFALFSQIYPTINGLTNSISVNNLVANNSCSGQNGMNVFLDEDGDCNINKYYLVFNEEFDGNTLDLNKWGIRPWGQGEYTYNYSNGLTNIYSIVQGYYTLDNVDVSNGTCKIYGKHETVVERLISWLPDNEILSDGFQNLRTFNYTAANIWSNKKMGTGYYEIRCKIPNCKGTGVAFWNYDNSPTNGWNELDVFEFTDDGTNNSRRRHAMNIHHHDNTTVSDDNLSCQTSYDSGIDFSSDFHTFTIKWTPQIIEWYVDGDLKRISTRFYNQLGQVVDCNSLQAYHPYIMDRAFLDPDPLYLIFSLAVSNTADNVPDISSFPAIFEIDYIRYWKQIDCSANIQIDNNDMIDPDLFNFYVGNNITVTNNITLQNNQQLNLTASESIVLEPGFTTQNNSFFEGKIEPNFCQQGFSGYIDINNNGENEVNKVNESKSLKIDNSINVSPNPTSNIINITGNDIVKVMVLNTNGKIIKTQNSINVNQISINLTDFSKGMYYLIIYDSKNNRKFEKVIKS